MAENTKPDPQNRTLASRIAWLGLAILTVTAFVVGLNLPLLGPDEPRYAQVAREMFERGDWVTPTLGGHNWFEKPALLYWLEIAAYNIFGVTEFAARLGPAIFGIGIVICLWLIGRATTDRESSLQTNDRPAIFAVIAASTVGIIAFAHGASFDIILTFPLTASLVCFCFFDQKRGNRSLCLIGFYVFIGVSLIAKGLIGALFPAAIVTFYHVLTWKWPSRALLLSIIWGTLLTAAVAAIWYMPMYARNGYQFIDEFIIQHHFQRFTSNKYQHPQPFYFFLWMLPVLTIPWLPFTLVGIRDAVRSLYRHANSSIGDADDRDPLVLFAFAWMLVPLVFFSFSGSKLPGYILPSVPGSMILAGIVATRFAARSSLRRYAVQLTAAITLLIVIGLLVFYMPKFAADDSVKALIAASDARGLTDAPVFCLQTVSHNAEFYAAGRVVRDDAGNIRRFGSTREIADYMMEKNMPRALVLVPRREAPQLNLEPALDTNMVRSNEDLSLIAVRPADSVVGCSINAI